jgi:hypothetical protein
VKLVPGRPGRSADDARAVRIDPGYRKGVREAGPTHNSEPTRPEPARDTLPVPSRPGRMGLIGGPHGLPGAYREPSIAPGPAARAAARGLESLRLGWGARFSA